MIQHTTSQFFVTLPSNVKVGQGVSNQIGRFKTVLPQRLVLSEDWEVALTSLTYPRSWTNITDGIFTYRSGFVGPEVTTPPKISTPSENDELLDDNDVSVVDDTTEFKRTLLTDEESVHAIIDGGYYKSPVSIINAILAKLPEGLIRIEYDENSEKCTVNINRSGATISFYPQLAYALGFIPYAEITTGRTQGSFPCNLDGGVNSLFIYGDIIRDQIVGNTFAQLLQIAPVRGKFGETVKIQYNSPEYYPLQVHDIASITIDVASDSGESLTFCNGKIIAQLHFRRKGLFR